MKNHFGLGLAALLAFSCGGGSGPKGAAAPPTSGGGTSQITLTTISSDGSPPSKFAISGPTYGVFDSASGAFHVFIVDGSSGSAPDCDHIKDLVKGAKARLVDLYLGKNVTAPGKVDAAGALAVDATSGTPQMSQGNVDGVALDFKSVDAKSFDADIVSASGSASGSVHGTICDGSKLRADPASGDPVSTTTAPPDEPTTGQTGPMFQLKTASSLHSMSSAEVLVKLDPKTKAMLVYLPPPDGSVSCDHLAVPAKAEMGRQYIVLGVKKIGARAPGKFPVSSVQITSFADAKPDVENATLDATIDIHQFDDKGFTADFASAPNATAILSGPVTGTVCADGHVTLPAGDKAAKPAKKKK